MSQLSSKLQTPSAASMGTAQAAAPQKHTSHKTLSGCLILFLGAILCLLVARLFGLSVPIPFHSEDRKFRKFAEEVFCEEMSGNTLNRHYTIAQPDSFHIKEGEVTLGNGSLEARKKSCASAENYLNALKKFDYEKLSDEHQLTYDIFADYLNTQLQGADYLLYDEPLSPTLGVQAQLPILLAEYTFRTKRDIEDYLALLTQIPDYFSSILSFERDKANAGLFMSRASAADVISQCNTFIADPKQNYLIGIFNEKIDEISNLTSDEKIAYKSRNQSILDAYVIPAYETLSSGLSALANSGKNDKGLSYLPQGREYYRYLVQSTVGDSREIEAIEEAIKRQMVADFSDIQKLSAQNGGILTPSGTGTTASPAALLSQLREKITEDFPMPPNVSCNIKYVHTSLENYLSPAFYLTPAIDDYENNVIYINRASNYDTLELFTTLAHEGYPGHLYQNVYFTAQEPDLLRCLMDTGGYTEGWATYVEMYSYSLWEDDPVYASISQKNRSFTLGLASLLDIGIHYRGYSLEEVSAFLQKLGFGTDTAASLYNSILQAPANYLKYYVGYLNFCDLRDAVSAAQKDRFSLREFHRMVLETGPAPFDILRKQLQKTLNS